MRTVKTYQTERIPRLICVLSGHTGHFVSFVILRDHIIFFELFQLRQLRSHHSEYVNVIFKYTGKFNFPAVLPPGKAVIGA